MVRLVKVVGVNGVVAVDGEVGVDGVLGLVKGPYIKYASSFSAYFDPPLHALSTHLADPPAKLRT